MGNHRDSSPTLITVTFSGNSALDFGGGMVNRINSSPTLTNCILWGNAADQGPQIYNTDASTPTTSYSEIEGSGGSGVSWDADLGTDGGNNIDANPLFVDPVPAVNAPTTAGNYRLGPCSPAVDAGNNNDVPPGVTIDLDGNPRRVDGTGDGNEVVDMGAYESHQIDPSLTITKQGQGFVTRTPEPLDCGVVCAAEFACGTVVALTTTAESGWTFVGQGGFGCVCRAREHLTRETVAI